MGTNNATVNIQNPPNQLAPFNPYTMDIPSMITQMIFQPGSINRSELIKKTVYAFAVKYCYDNLNKLGSMVLNKQLLNGIIIRLIYSIRFYSLKFKIDDLITEKETDQQMDVTIMNNLSEVDIKKYQGVFFKRVLGRFVIFNITETDMEIMSFCKKWNEKFMTKCRLPVSTIGTKIKTQYNIISIKKTDKTSTYVSTTPIRVTKLINDTKDHRFFKMIETFIVNSEILEDIATQAYIINGQVARGNQLLWISFTKNIKLT